MTSAEHQKSNLPDHPKPTEEMSEYGITRVPIDYVHCKDYRYTNLKDAIAQAKRNRAVNGEKARSF